MIDKEQVFSVKATAPIPSGNWEIEDESIADVSFSGQNGSVIANNKFGSTKLTVESAIGKRAEAMIRVNGFDNPNFEETEQVTVASGISATVPKYWGMSNGASLGMGFEVVDNTLKTTTGFMSSYVDFSMQQTLDFEEINAKQVKIIIDKIKIGVDAIYTNRYTVPKLSINLNQEKIYADPIGNGLIGDVEQYNVPERDIVSFTNDKLVIYGACSINQVYVISTDNGSNFYAKCTNFIDEEPPTSYFDILGYIKDNYFEFNNLELTYTFNEPYEGNADFMLSTLATSNAPSTEITPPKIYVLS